MRRIFACAALAAASTLIAFAVQGQADAQGRPRIILFQEDNFRGAQIEVTGEEPRIKLRNFDDRVSSVRVISGIWELCADDVYRGTCITVGRDEPHLDRYGFDDVLSSLRPAADRRDARDDRRDDRRDNRRNDSRDNRRGGFGGGDGLTVYEDVNYQGRSRAMGTEVANVGSAWNDRVSSIRVRSGTWQLCQDENFGGRCITVSSDVPNMVAIGFNDEVTSVRRIR